MILPTIHVPPKRALLGVGGDILRILDGPTTIEKLWDKFRNRQSKEPDCYEIDYRWFVLALDLLYALGAVELEGDMLRTAR